MSLASHSLSNHYVAFLNRNHVMSGCPVIIEEWKFIILAERALHNPASSGKNKIKQSQTKVPVVIPALEKLMEKDHKLEATLCYTVKLCCCC